MRTYISPLRERQSSAPIGVRRYEDYNHMPQENGAVIVAEGSDAPIVQRGLAAMHKLGVSDGFAAFDKQTARWSVCNNKRMVIGEVADSVL